MKLLVTGGAGFIGSNFVRHVLTTHPSDQVINVDLLTYAGNLENLTDIAQQAATKTRYHFYKLDICNGSGVREVVESHQVDAIVNFAAESHVDRSVQSSAEFVRTNITGTQVLMDVARQCNIARFVQVSTDEVYGSLGPTGSFSETTPLAPNSPYSASKTAADLLARAYFHTHNFPVVTTRCSNNYGPYQFPEKLIPLMITNALEDKTLPVYGDGMNVRDWISVDDHCRGVDLVLRKGREGEVYNLGSNCEKPNIEIVKTILKILDKSEDLINYVTDRPGHDRRYAMDVSKIGNELGWQPQDTFEAYIKKTVDWYLQNRTWWQRVKSGAYQDYYDQQYGER